MSDFTSANSDLVSAFDTAWASVEPTVRILHDNSPPLNPQPSPAGGEWVRISVLHGQGKLPEIGSRDGRNAGRVVVAIFVGLGRGNTRSLAMAGKVRDIFQGKRLGATRCYESEAVVVGADPANLWFQVNVSTRFDFTSTPV